MNRMNAPEHRAYFNASRCYGIEHVVRDWPILDRMALDLRAEGFNEAAYDLENILLAVNVLAERVESDMPRLLPMLVAFEAWKSGQFDRAWVEKAADTYLRGETP